MASGERDYSARTRVDKLGIKPGHRVALIRMRDPAVFEELIARTPFVTRGRAGSGRDIILLAADSPSDLAVLTKLRDAIVPSGAIWVVYPKGVRAITQAQVMSAIKSAGMTDNKVCSFSATHTALRAVIPKALRPL